MTAQVGYLDPYVGRGLTASDVAAITTIQICFYTDCLSESVNSDCLDLWQKILEWNDEDDIADLSVDNFIELIRGMEGFSETNLNNSNIFRSVSCAYEYISYMEDVYYNIRSILGTTID